MTVTQSSDITYRSGRRWSDKWIIDFTTGLNCFILTTPFPKPPTLLTVRINVNYLHWHFYFKDSGIFLLTG
jgi:hypothetical protein